MGSIRLWPSLVAKSVPLLLALYACGGNDSPGSESGLPDDAPVTMTTVGGAPAVVGVPPLDGSGGSGPGGIPAPGSSDQPGTAGGGGMASSEGSPEFPMTDAGDSDAPGGGSTDGMNGTGEPITPVDGPGDEPLTPGDGDLPGEEPDDGMGEAPAETGCQVAPITQDMRTQYRNMGERYYTKYASANGVIIATGDKVGDEAIVRYCRLMKELAYHDEIRQSLVSTNMWFTMISEDEQLSSLPQIDRAYGTSLNRRARGLGGLTPTICAEDSIMCMRGDPWYGDCICAHETGHTLYSSGIRRVPELSRRLTAITDSVRASGRLANAYVWMDGDESGMMAWGVQAWYDCAVDGRRGGYHSDINTRAELAQELPEFYEFLSDILPADTEYEDCYAQ